MTAEGEAEVTILEAWLVFITTVLSLGLGMAMGRIDRVTKDLGEFKEKLK